MASKQVLEFNAGLVARDEQIGIRAYLKRLNDEVFKQPIDAFVDDLLDLVIQDECCIPHDRLMKYGVLSGTSASAQVVRMLHQYELAEGVDYHSTTLSNGTHGGIPAKVYHLHPDAFELCLMRAKNTRQYARFYGLLRKCVSSYDKYQLERERCKSERLSDELKAMFRRMEQNEDEHRRSRAEMKADVTEMKTDLREIKGQNAELKGQNAEIKDQNVELKTVLTSSMAEMRQTTDAIATAAHQSLALLEVAAQRHVKKAADRAPPPGNPAKVETFILLRAGTGAGAEYAAIRCQTKGIARAVGDRSKTLRQRPLQEVLRIEDVPNSKHLWNRSREALGDRIRTAANTAFTLAPGTTEAEVLDVLQEVNAAPTSEAECLGNATKAWADGRRVIVAAAEGQAAHTATVVETVTTTKKTTTFALTDQEMAALLDDLLT